MHRSSYNRMQYLVEYYEQYFNVGKDAVKVLDIGSYDVNGTYREIFSDRKYLYSGLDMCKGPNVDIVPSDIYKWKEIDDSSFDMAISGQAFEHIEYPWLTIKEIARVLKPGGYCIVTAPNLQVEHKYPTDCYRYFSDGLTALAKWAELKVWHASVAGIPRADVDDSWTGIDNDAFVVAQKYPYYSKAIKDPFPYERRMGINLEVKTLYRSFENFIKNINGNEKKVKKFALFGAGKIGAELFEKIGGDNVEFFIDNNEKKTGTLYCQRKVLSLDEFVSIAEQYECIISVDKEKSFDVYEQLLQIGIKGHLVYTDAEHVGYLDEL